MLMLTVWCQILAWILHTTKWQGQVEEWWVVCGEGS